MVFVKEESEIIRIEETFRVKNEDTEEQTKMVFMKEESENIKNEEQTDSCTNHDDDNLEEAETSTCSTASSHTPRSKRTDITGLKEDKEVPNEIEKKDQFENLHYSITGDKSLCCSQSEKTSTSEEAQKTGNTSHFTCFECGKSFRFKGSLKRHINPT